ncbi:hypothetical protein BB559_002224 [Furculomyces boomerangus]|uniref:RGS domain-containing protein n=2 Tax=Harpellales TaxID=61421 RepID=A0A2T9YX08_9FUNG|nr:hypothetical protein BB559_002224 [Furculomyces boomerangus]PWA02366.1 hypothetical protein BB558_001493 [Smittium angustum]
MDSDAFNNHQTTEYKPNSMWDPFHRFFPPLGSRLAFSRVNSPKYKRMFAKLPTLQDCLENNAQFPLCLYGYKNYLKIYEHCDQDLDFLLETQNLMNKERRLTIRSQRNDNRNIPNYNSPRNTNSPPFRNSSPIDTKIGCLQHKICQQQTQKTDISTAPKQDPTSVFFGENNENRDYSVVEQIYLKHIVQNSPRQIHIPQEIREQTRIGMEIERIIGTSVLDPAKKYVSMTMKHETYPRFLKECYNHNINESSAIWRLTFGLFLLVVALTTEFSLILLNIVPKSYRWIPLIAFFLGFLYTLSALYRLDPGFAMFRKTNLFSNTPEHIYSKPVLHHHRKIAAVITLVSALTAVILTLIFYLVPGARLYQ